MLYILQKIDPFYFLAFEMLVGESHIKKINADKFHEEEKAKQCGKYTAHI